MIAQVVGIAVGLSLMAAPAAAGYVDTAAGDLHRTIGPLTATAAIIAIWAATRDVRWANLGLATVLAIAPLFADHPAPATVVAAVAAAALAAGTPFAGADRARRGRGWRGVVATDERS